jgi:tRNA nucleotidyltransferase (CCA-adding enzyme)
MEIYLVGGAVRDRLLNIPSKDKDFLVVGSSPEKMIDLGFKPIGKDFPVFLHPKTKEEYALARTEKKIAAGHKGFEFYASPDVSLEDDLRRRDITINAIAVDSFNNYIDPYGGINDIKKKIIRHVSPSFEEDPLRVLRVARFQAKLPSFTINDETMLLMKKIVSGDEICHLSAERIMGELIKGMEHKDAFSMLNVLDQCNALNTIFPAIAFAKNKAKVKKIFHCANKYDLSSNRRLLLFLLSVNFEINSISSNIHNNTSVLNLPSESKKIITLMQRYTEKLILFADLYVEEQLDMLCTFDFFRRSHIVIECMELIGLILEGSELDNAPLLRGKSLILSYLDILAENKIIVDTAMTGEQIKNKLYAERLSLLEKLKNR